MTKAVRATMLIAFFLTSGWTAWAQTPQMRLQVLSGTSLTRYEAATHGLIPQLETSRERPYAYVLTNETGSPLEAVSIRLEWEGGSRTLVYDSFFVSPVTVPIAGRLLVTPGSITPLSERRMRVPGDQFVNIFEQKKSVTISVDMIIVAGKVIGPDRSRLLANLQERRSQVSELYGRMASGRGLDLSDLPTEAQLRLKPLADMLSQFPDPRLMAERIFTNAKRIPEEKR